MPLPRAPRVSAWLLAALLFAALYWTFDLVVLAGGVPHTLDDHWEESIIARHLLAGDGYRTSMIYPPLWGFRDAESLTIPVLVHGPVIPLFMVVPLALFGPAALDHVAWAAALFAVLTLVPLFRLTARHFGEPLGLGACVLLTLAPLTLGGVHHSLSVMVGAWLITLVLDLLARSNPRPVLAGALAGIAYLVRPEMLLGAAVLALFAARITGPGGMIRFALGFAFFPFPWWLHHWMVAGSPLFNVSSYNLVGSWGRYPELSVLRDFDLTPDRFPAVLREALPTLWKKWAVFFLHGAKHALFSPSGGTGWLALVGLVAVLWKPRDAREAKLEVAAVHAEPFAHGIGFGTTTHETRALVVTALALAMIPVLTSTIAVYQVLYMVPFMPLYAMGAAIGARLLAERMRVPRIWWLVLAILMVPSVFVSLREGMREARTLRVTLASERAALAVASNAATPPLGPRARLAFSDTPDFVAWTTGIPTLWLSRDEYLRLYASGAAARHGLPPRERVLTWFHDDPRAAQSRGRADGP